MSLPSLAAFRVWQRNRDVFFRLWKAESIPYFIEPLVILTALGLGLGTFIGQVNGQSYLEFLAPGVVAGYAMFSATFECTYASFVRMEMQRTFDAIIATPLSIEDVIAGEILWAATRSLMTALAIVLVSLAFGVVPSVMVIGVFPVAVLIGLMFGSIAMFYTSIVPSIASFNYFFTLFVTPVYFFSGVFFPLSSLPQTIQGLAWLVPLTPAVNLTRALFYGQVTAGLAWSLAFVLAVTGLFLFLSLVSMRRRLIK